MPGAREQALGARVVQLSALELSYRASTGEENALKRRFMTLSIPVQANSMWRGGVGYVVRAKSLATGESFALKRLKGRVGGDEADERARKLAASFRQEYDAHRLLSPTGLVPELFGWATLDGEPAILMEWVEGLTLHDAAKELRGTDGRVPLTIVADIGISVLAALQRVEAVDASLVHRDLSPRNIMVRTAERPLPDQVESGIYDICLIDFGSATVEQGGDGSFTVAENLWRGATPDYAPPEMLAHDLDGLVGLRRSSSIDVYALCSVLYELYTGRTPYDVGAQAERVPYQVKSTDPPARIERREGDEDGRLAGMLLSGLAVEQGERPTVEALAAELIDWEEAHGTSRPWEQTLGAGIASDATAVPKSTAPVSPTVLRMKTRPPENVGQQAAARPGFWKRHRHLAVVCGVVAVVLAGVLAAGSQTHWFGIEAPIPKASLEEYSWNDLSRISQKIAGAEDGYKAQEIESEYRLVDEEGYPDFSQVKSVELAGGTQTCVCIVGFRHDEKADGSGLAGITFAFAEPVGEHVMESEAAKTRRWSDTELRAWLNGEFEEELPDDLRDAIVEVEKESLVLTRAEGDDGEVSGFDDAGDDASYDASTETTADKLWAFSDAEMGMLSYNGVVADTLGLTVDDVDAMSYKAYSKELQAELDQQNLVELIDVGGGEGDGSDGSDGSDDASWLRAPSEDSASGYRTTGGADESCAQKLPVEPGFCI